MDGAARHFEEEWQRLYTNAGCPGPDTLPPGPARESIRAWARDGTPPPSPEHATAAFHFLRSAARKLGCPEEELPTVERLFALWREAAGAGAGTGPAPTERGGGRPRGYGAPPPLGGTASADAPAPAAPGAPAAAKPLTPPAPPPLGAGETRSTITGQSQLHGPVIQTGHGPTTVNIHQLPVGHQHAPVPQSRPPEPPEPPEQPKPPEPGAPGQPGAPHESSDPPDATPVLQVQDGSMKLTFFNDRVAEMWITVRWGSQQ